jgi:fatty acid desaturase
MKRWAESFESDFAEHGMIRKSKGTTAERKRPSVEWLTLALMVGCYGAWFAAGISFHTMPIVAIIVIPLMITFQSSLQHEALHGHPTRNARVNEALVFMPIGIFYPYRRYKNLHLRHHADERLTDPYDDPESYYRALSDWEKLPGWMKYLLKFNNAFVARVLVGPAISIAGFIITECKHLASGRRADRTAWLLHLAGLVPVVLIVHFVFDMSAWVYFGLTYMGLAVLSIRSFCEHQWSERPDGRTVIIEKTALGLLFLNNNLHLVHHKRPSAPWYQLPRLYREQREEWSRMNEGYVFQNYLQVLRSFALKGKEPVVHPQKTGVPSSALSSNAAITQ